MIYFYFKTLFSFRFYHRLAFASFKQMLPYALFLYVLSVVVSFFAAGAYVNKNMPLFLKNFPQVTFEKGVLTEPAHPVSAKIPQTDFKITFDAVAPMPPSDKELIRSGTLFWVNKNTIYSPASGRLDTKLIPADFSFVSSQENLEKEKAFLIFSTRLMLFFFSLLTIPFVLFFGFCLAATVGMVCKMWYRNRRVVCWGRKERDV